MKQPIIGQKVNDQAIDSLIDAVEALADADAIFYVGYPVAATVEAPITIPALLISGKYGLVCFDVVPSAKGSDLLDIKARQRSIVLALKAKLLQHPDLANEEDLAFKVNIIEEVLGGNARAPQFFIQIIKQGRELFEDGVQMAFNGPQWMVRGHAGVQVNDRQEIGLGLRFSTHGFQTHLTRSYSNSRTTFSTNC